MNTQTKTTLILGGSASKTGRRVADRMSARGLPMRLASRSSELPFDWHDEKTWPRVLAGVGSACITYYPGHNAHVTDGVERALGRKPKDFRSFARDAAQAWAQ